MPLIQVTSGGQRSLLKKKLQVCESQQSCLFVGDQILIFHHNMQINSLKSYNVIFWIFFLILSLTVEVYLWWKLQASLIFLSGRTCTVGGWLNTFLPHCKCIQIAKAKKLNKTTNKQTTWINPSPDPLYIFPGKFIIFWHFTMFSCLCFMAHEESSWWKKDCFSYS